MANFAQLELHNKNRWIYFTKYRWLAHVAFWIWVLGVNFYHAEPATPALRIVAGFVVNNLPIAVFFYLYCLVLIPHFFKKNKILWFWIALMACFVCFPAFSIYYDRAFPMGDAANNDTGKGFGYELFMQFGNYFLNFLIFSMMLFFMEKNEEQDTLLELEKEKKDIEQVKLDLLKTNISPDFLMRSLKQLKTAAAEDRENTPESILTFSDLMRYRLYRGRQQFAPLKEEISALEAFISFIHFDPDHQLNFSLDIKGKSEDRNITPLALVNILEIFCKTVTDRAVSLKIFLHIQAENLLLELHYNTNPGPALIQDLNKYGDNYRQLYGENVHFEFKNCDDNDCLIRMSLPFFQPA